MLTAITWSQFLIFVFCFTALYYLTYAAILYTVKRRGRWNDKKREPQVAPFAAADNRNDLREPLKEVIEPTGLIHEIRLHLQQITPYDFTRDETILSVKKVIQTYKEEKAHLGKDGFKEQTKRSFHMMCSITLTPEELTELWEA